MRLRLMLIALLALAGVGFRAAQPAAAATCFPQSGKCIHVLFEGYWSANGGLAQQGYPLTDAFVEVSAVDGKPYLVQYFERARFEHHPENAGTAYEVLLGQLGREQYLARYPGGRPPGGAGEVCFPTTGRCVRGVFYQYWLANGGLAQQGYPLSDEFDEVNPTDGKTYRVQYFERARFEHHPENAGTAYEVLLGLLGREQYLAKYGQQPPAAPLDGEERALLDLVNGYRARNGLAPLALSPTLSQAAEWLSADMAQKGYFDHTDSLGRDPFARMCAFGYCYDTWKGETLAAGNGDAAATLRQWQESPAHNAILLEPRATAIGVGRAQGGGYGWYWTADFGGERD